MTNNEIMKDKGYTISLWVAFGCNRKPFWGYNFEYNLIGNSVLTVYIDTAILHATQVASSSRKYFAKFPYCV